MIYGIYSIRDAKTGFMTPSIDINSDSAIRNFAFSLIGVPTVISTFAKDFDLYQLGSFDTDSGRLVPLDVPMYIMSGPAAMALGESLREVSERGGNPDARSS